MHPQGIVCTHSQHCQRLSIVKTVVVKPQVYYKIIMIIAFFLTTYTELCVRWTPWDQ